MMNLEIFDKVRAEKAKILVVTKYWGIEKTECILNFCRQNYADIFFGLGENRIEKIQEKRSQKDGIQRNLVHFIGNIQSKKIPEIIQSCSLIHSLDDLKHAKIMQKFLEKNKSLSPLDVFLQIQLDPKKASGIRPEDFENFLNQMQKFPALNILGISGMGIRRQDSENLKDFEIEKAQKFKILKKQEFETLKKLRDKFLSGKLISAGTSQDYEIALDCGIEVIRVGQGLEI